MFDASTQKLLQGLLRRENRSLLLYVSESYPWTAGDEQDAVAQLGKLIEEEQKAVASLSRFLSRRRLPTPFLGTYPSGFTSINFVSLDHLWPMLVTDQQQAAAALERDLGQIRDAEARAEVEKLLATKHRHLEVLKSLAAAHPETVAH